MPPFTSRNSSPACALVNLGCRVNHAEIEVMRLALEDVGIRIGDTKNAEVVVVNTCAVTGEAEAKSRKTIRHLAHMPSIQSIYVTGCAANLFEEEFAALAKKVVLVQDKTSIPQRIKKMEGLSSEDDAPSEKPLTLSRMRREVKIQDGCNNTCSYCVVRRARGSSHSVPVRDIVQQVKRAHSEGIGEIVLAGINLGQFRLDEKFAKSAGIKADTTSLATLIRHLLETVPLARIRLSSIEPSDIDTSLIDLMVRNPQRIASYLHVPLQSGANTILQTMNRPYTVQEFEKAVRSIRAQLPHIALATDIIVGFPGETEDNFQETYELAKRMQFSKVHLFRYSQRPGTSAARRPDQIPPEIKAQRAHELHLLAVEMRHAHAQSLLGKAVQVYVESPGRGKSEGLFEAKIPKEIPVGTLCTVSVKAVRRDCLVCF